MGPHVPFGKPLVGSLGLLLPISWPSTVDCAVGPQLLNQCSESAFVGIAVLAPVEMPCWPNPLRTASGVSPSIDSVTFEGEGLNGPSTVCVPSVTECTQLSLASPT